MIINDLINEPALRLPAAMRACSVYKRLLSKIPKVLRSGISKRWLSVPVLPNARHF